MTIDDKAQFKTDDKTPLKIVKPAAGFMDKFRAKKAPSIAGVDTVLSALPTRRLADVKDWFRLHPDEENYWSPELCFCDVPVKGVKQDVLHLIDEEIATEHLPANRILRRRLALGSKPHDVFFLAIVPTMNLENSWNMTTLQACERAKNAWTGVASRRPEGVDDYQISFAKNQDAFPPVQWPKRTLDEILEVTFRTHTIDTDQHPSFLRLIGAKLDLT